MKLSTRLFGASYRFRSIKELLARANETRSGDELAGIAARSEKERIAAKNVLADLTLNDLRENPERLKAAVASAVNEYLYAAGDLVLIATFPVLPARSRETCGHA